MGVPFRPDGSGPQSAVLQELARLWEQAAHRRAAIGERLTQRWLAETSGVPEGTISDWATGAHQPRDLDKLTAVGRTLAAAAGETPLTSVAWSKLLEADRLRRPTRATDEDDPVIAAFRRHHHTKPVLSELVVDADPPRPVWGNGTMLVITLATRHGEVHLHEMRPVVHLRQSPRRACFGLTGSYAAGVVPSRIFTLDLDPVPALLKAEDEHAGATFKITPTDSEEFRVTISATKAEVSFHLEIDWTCLGRSGTTVINNNGKPFEIYPGRHSDLDWGCGGRHKRGCPAERLAASSSQGRVRWFDKSSGLGFIIPDGGGADLYFHRKSLVPGSARHLPPEGELPREGDLVAYEVERTKFEPRAVRVRFR
jgi:cold shock CspA family protein